MPSASRLSTLRTTMPEMALPCGPDPSASHIMADSPPFGRSMISIESPLSCEPNFETLATAICISTWLFYIKILDFKRAQLFCNNYGQSILPEIKGFDSGLKSVSPQPFERFLKNGQWRWFLQGHGIQPAQKKIIDAPRAALEP